MSHTKIELWRRLQRPAFSCALQLVGLLSWGSLTYLCQFFLASWSLLLFASVAFARFPGLAQGDSVAEKGVAVQTMAG